MSSSTLQDTKESAQGWSQISAVLGPQEKGSIFLCFTGWNLEVQGFSDTSFSPRGQLPPQLPFNVQAGLVQVDVQLLPASLLASSVLSGFPVAAQAGGCCVPPRLQIQLCKELAQKMEVKAGIVLNIKKSGLATSCFRPWQEIWARCELRWYKDSQLHGEQESKGGGKEL